MVLGCLFGGRWSVGFDSAAWSGWRGRFAAGFESGTEVGEWVGRCVDSLSPFSVGFGSWSGWGGLHVHFLSMGLLGGCFLFVGTGWYIRVRYDTVGKGRIFLGSSTRRCV